MIGFVVWIACVGAIYYLLSRTANGRGMPTREEVAMATAAYRARSQATVERRRTSVRREVVSVFAPTQRVDWAIVGAAFAAAVGLSFAVGGVLHGSVMLGIVALCLTPALVWKVRSVVEVRRLMRRARLSHDEPLYVPEEWQKH